MVTDEDDGGSVVVRTGQILGVVLADDYQTSMCQWEVEQLYPSAVLQFVERVYEPKRVPPGGGELGTWTGRFRATGVGAADVALIQRDDRNPAHIARRYRITLSVRQSAF